MSKSLTLNALRAEFPDATPAALYNVACLRLDVDLCWEKSSWTACANWMDMFANAPTSYQVH